MQIENIPASLKSNSVLNPKARVTIRTYAVNMIAIKIKVNPIRMLKILNNILIQLRLKISKVIAKIKSSPNMEKRITGR